MQFYFNTFLFHYFIESTIKFCLKKCSHCNMQDPVGPRWGGPSPSPQLLSKYPDHIPELFQCENPSHQIEGVNHSMTLSRAPRSPEA